MLGTVKAFLIAIKETFWSNIGGDTSMLANVFLSTSFIVGIFAVIRLLSLLPHPFHFIFHCRQNITRHISRSQIYVNETSRFIYRPRTVSVSLAVQYQGKLPICISRYTILLRHIDPLAGCAPLWLTRPPAPPQGQTGRHALQPLRHLAGLRSRVGE